MAIRRGMLAGLCIQLLLALDVLCLCPHEMAAAASASHSGCPSHAPEAPEAPSPDHAPMCPHCGDHGPFVAASGADIDPPASHRMVVGSSVASPVIGAEACEVLARAPSPAGLSGRSRLTRHCVLRV